MHTDQTHQFRKVISSKKCKSLFCADVSAPWSVCAKCTWILSAQKPVSNFSTIIFHIKKLYLQLNSIVPFPYYLELYESCSSFFCSMQCVLGSPLATLEEGNGRGNRSTRKNNTCDVVDLPKSKELVGCKWVFLVKL